MPQGGYGGGTAAPTNKKPIVHNYARPQSQTKKFQDEQRWYGAQIDQALPSYQDPFNGANVLDMLTHGLNPGGGGAGHGSGGGGGGGGAAASAAQRNAALDAVLQQELSGISQGYAGQQSALDTLGQQQTAGFDQRDASLHGIQAGADTRLQGILGDLNAGAGAARGATQQAYGAGDQRLQALMAEYQNIAGARDQAANQTLGAFGAASGGTTGSVNPSGGGVQDMLMAGRTANTMRGNAADELYAQRGNVYNGLNADARTQNGQAFDSLLAKLTMDRQAQSQSIAAQRAALAAQQAQAEAQARTSNAQARV